MTAQIARIETALEQFITKSDALYKTVTDAMR